MIFNAKFAPLQRGQLQLQTAWLGLCLAVAILGGCAAGADRPPTVRIMTFNTQNMFDDHRDGGEYPEFQPGGSGGWNRTLYRTRLERLAAVIRDQAIMPDIVVLEEIETQKVLEDLCRDFLPADAYPLRLLQADAGSIHIALLSRFPLVSLRSHRIWLDGESGRSIWELSFNPFGQPMSAGKFSPGDPAFSGFVLFANHWKSKSGGEAETEAMRLLAAKTLRQRTAELREAWPHLPIIACGDFNEILHPVGASMAKVNPRSRAHRLPVRPSLSGAAGSPVIALGWLSAAMEMTSSRAVALPVAAWTERATVKNNWYSPWNLDGTDEQGRPGSYRYRGKWEGIDHFLLSAGLVENPNWHVQSFRVIGNPALLDQQGNPWRWDSRSKTGTSDHLPLLLELRKINKR